MAREKKEEEAALRQPLEKATVLLQDNPRDEQSQQELTVVADKLRAFERVKVKGQRLRRRLKWKNYVDKFQCLSHHRVRGHTRSETY